jgi:hypothetical protein
VSIERLSSAADRGGPENENRTDAGLKSQGESTMTVRSFRLAATAVLSFAAGSLVSSQLTRAQSVRAAGDRVFELRVYQSFPGRLPRLQSNFRDHNLSFLKKHGITALRERKIDWHDLYGVQAEDIVPSGVAELARLQGIGFVYIHL